MPAFVLDTDMFSLFLKGHPPVCENVAPTTHTTSDDIAATLNDTNDRLMQWLTANS